MNSNGPIPGPSSSSFDDLVCHNYYYDVMIGSFREDLAFYRMRQEHVLLGGSDTISSEVLARVILRIQFNLSYAVECLRKLNGIHGIENGSWSI